MASVKFYNFILTLSCLTGVALSIYAYMVELQAQENSNYEALCDINEYASCSRVFTSEYGKGLGFIGKLLGEKSPFNVPNSLYGIVAYSLLATLAQSDSYFITRLSFWLILLANGCSIYFAYILTFILRDFCVVCVSTYLVNALNMTFVLCKLGQLRANVDAGGTKGAAQRKKQK